MKNLFYDLFLITVCYCLSSRKLDTNGTAAERKLIPGDYILSTMGIFRATLEKTGCGIRAEIFNNLTNGYDFKGKYFSPDIKKDCSQLRIMPGQLQTQLGEQYLAAINDDYNQSTTFTIDDQGVMRLISTYKLQSLTGYKSNETVINDFFTPNKYIQSYSQLTFSFDGTFSLNNERNWNYFAQNGQITISRVDNFDINVIYVFSKITIRDTKIYDFNNADFPAAMFQNITFEPRCKDPTKYLDFQPPYVFHADPYWPIGTVLDQGGYKILQVAYSKLPQHGLNQNLTEIYFHRSFSPCPRRTFEYRGDCVGICPAPYYHQIKGQSGFCVLNCQQYSTVDESKKICGCVTSYEYDKLSLAKLVTACPSSATETPYGCQCNENGFFFDGKYSFTCVQKCPNRTFGINKICMSCPDHCQTCQKDQFHRMFLQCTDCRKGYVKYQGQCIEQCNANLAYFNPQNNICLVCGPSNCIKCQVDPNVCQKCSLMWSLQNGACVGNICSIVDTCNIVNNQYSYSNFFNSTCLNKTDQSCLSFLQLSYKQEAFLKCDTCFNDMLAYLDTCVIQCPPGYIAFNKYCVCSGSNLTVGNKCLNISGCPIGMSFDIQSHSCLNCPFGCMSCYSDLCTSCNPGYFLYVSPQAVLCRRKGPLFTCDQQNSWQLDSVCTLTNYTDPTLLMTQCLSTIINCKICIPQSTKVCAVCMEGFQLYNNTCLSQCPPKLIKYMQTCILPEIQHCAVPHLLSIHGQDNVNLQKITTSSAYSYFTNKLSEMANDPVGYIPYFQNLISGKSDGFTRQSDFFSPTWTCLKCDNGYGLSQHSNKCIPCPSQCPYKLCYLARIDSCLGPNRAECGIYQYIDQQTNACLQSCNSSQKFPEVRGGKLYCVSASKSNIKDYMRVDSAVYKMKDGKYLTFFVLSHKLDPIVSDVNVQSFSQQVKKTIKVAQSSGDTTNNITPTAIPTNKLIGDIPNNILSTPVQKSPIQDNQYIALQNSTFPAHIMDLNDIITKLTSANDVVFPSKVYGTVYLADHTTFMKTWLAFIGYVMAIVIILLHAVFIGNQLLYKVDNLLVFIQTIFYFAYVKNLVGRLLAQYYFGWSFAHARFLPNLFSQIIPDHYVEMRAPIPYKLINIDGNYFRNAGFSLAWVLIYMACWGVVSFFIWAILSKLCRKVQTWYPRVSRQALAAGIQFFSMNLMFFSISQLAYSGDAYLYGFQDYFDRSQILAIITIATLFIYSLVRFFFNAIGGLYMFKRILIAVILVFGYQIILMVLPLIALELLFALFRYIIQQPITKFEKISIWVESLLIIGCYLLLFFCVDAGVNSIIISIFIFIFIVYLAYDLITIYLESRNQFPEQQLIKEYQELASEINKQRANTVVYINGNKKNENYEKGVMSSIMEKY